MMASKSLDYLKQENLLRASIPYNHRKYGYILSDKKTYINFASNDYLGLAGETSILNAFANGINKHGFGSSASVAVSGYHKAQQQFEYAMSEFLERERAVFFNSGYLANIGAITALTDREDKLLIDKRAHASLYDGILLSRANYKRYPHQDMRAISQQLTAYAPTWLITEGVFSIEGDITPVPDLVHLTQAYQTQLMIDDAHGLGILGQHGRGISEHFQLSPQAIDCLITPLGKAFGGVGAIVAGEHRMIEQVIQYARSYRYTTALPPAIFYGLLQAVKLVKKDSWRRDLLQERIAFFIQTAIKLGISLLSIDKTPIKTIVIGDNHRCIEIQRQLQTAGFLVGAMRPPTVAPKQAALRITLSCLHTETMLKNLLEHISRCLEPTP